MSLYKHTTRGAGTDGDPTSYLTRLSNLKDVSEKREGADFWASVTLRRQIQDVLAVREPCLRQVKMTWLRLDPAYRHRKQT